MMPFGRGDYGSTFNFLHTLTNLSDDDLLGRVVCYLCSDIPLDPVKTDVSSLVCPGALEVLLTSR
jgi:hypothetical protein